MHIYILSVLYLFLSVCGSPIEDANIDLDINENTIDDDIEEPLILTTLLNEGKIKEARLAAKVTQFDEFHAVESYSGYFSIDEKFDSSLFFWFFPSKTNYLRAPVILWLQGGPGSSSLNGLFFENGPFMLNPDKTLQKREHSWTNTFSMIYLDNPVGAGFSYTRKNGYGENQTAIGNGICKALLQFFILFPELQRNDFFIVGESYAGKYIPGAARAIHYNNLKDGYKINLKGFAVGGGLYEPKYQFHYGDVLYHTGIIDFNVRDEILNLENLLENFIISEEWMEAFDIWRKLLATFTESSGYKSLYNYMETNKYLYDYNLLSEYMNDKKIKSALHVGNADYTAQDYVSHRHLVPDIMKSIAPWLSELLNHYRVLLYSGQLDTLVPYTSTQEFLKVLVFSGAEEYKTALRRLWYVRGDLAGYVKEAGNLTEVLVRKSGHSLPADQSAWTLELLTKFTSNQPLYNNN